MASTAPITGTGTIQTGLGGSAGLGEVAIARSDDGSTRLDLSAVFEDGLNYFGVLYDASAVFVNTNGTLSFLSGLADFPTSGNADLARDVIAPFWGDVDTRLDGEGAESGGIWADIDPVSDTVTLTWSQVGVYRRNAEVTNTFQLQLVDRGGGDFDIVFRYDSIGWTLGSGLTDSGARAGLTSSRLVDPNWLFEVDNAAGLSALPGTAGNTGVTGLWVYEMRDGTIGDLDPVPGKAERGTAAGELLEGTWDSDLLIGMEGNDTLNGVGGDDSLDGGPGDDLIDGGDQHDTIFAGDGTDTVVGGWGDDFILAGDTEQDLRDVVYGGGGDDMLDGGYGNDELRGDAGNDTLTGGWGVDDILGGDGDDVLTGQAWSDLIYGGTGSDFINGGFGHDRLNGGTGPDRFYHVGIFDHGSDWIQDYAEEQGDVLVYGGTASRDDFQVNFTHTPDAGNAALPEAFVIYRPTEQILWALVDGGAEARIVLSIGTDSYNLFL